MTPTLLEKIKGLQYFAGLRDLKRILVEFLSTVTALETNSVAVGKATAKIDGINSGTPLIVGRKYFTTGVSPGDDFTNVGWVSDEVAFIATGTTPTVWIDSNLNLITESVTLFFNDIDPLISVRYNETLSKGEIIITNGAFNNLKTYPVVEQTQVIVVDNNTLRTNDVLLDYYFKIEVYN